MGLLRPRSNKPHFSEPNVMVANSDLKIPELAELHQLVKKFAPLVCFHPEEECMPLPVETYLQKAWLINTTSNIRILAAVNSLADRSKSGKGYYLEPLEAEQISGESRQAKLYVHAKLYQETHVDLQYWFFYARTRSSSAAVKWLIDGSITGYEGTIDLEPLGENNGCWERITVRVSITTREAEQVLLPLSGRGAWFPITQVLGTNGRIQVYASKGNAGFHPKAGMDHTEKIRFNLYSSQLEFCLQHESKQGTTLDFSSSCELVSAPYLQENKPVEPQWLDFLQHWGNPRPDYLALSSVKRIVMSTFGKDLEFLLSKDVFYELVNYLTKYFTEQCHNRSLSPKARGCWEGEETELQ